MKTRNKTAMVGLGFFFCATFAHAQPAIYKDADYKLGEDVTSVAAVINRDHYKFK